MTDRYVPVKGFPNLVRDMDTGVLHNTDLNGIEQARESKRLRKLKKQQQEDLESRVATLENELSLIKEHLKNI